MDTPLFEQPEATLERVGIPGHHLPDPSKHACTRDLWTLPPASRVFDSNPPHYQRDFASVQYEVFPSPPTRRWLKRPRR